MHFIIYFPKRFTVHYVLNSFDFLKDPIYWVVVILENENRTCLRHLSSILFLAPFRKKHLAYIKMLISTLSRKKKRKTDFAFIISLNFLGFTTFQIAFIFEKISSYWVALLLEHENSALSTCLQFFSSPPWGKKHLKDTDTTVIYISSFQELIDMNNFLFLELLTNDDNVLCSMNRAREYNS